MVSQAASSQIRVAHGAREAEELLLSEVSQWIEQASRNPALLSYPLRIVVPSRSLREHLAALLVRRLRPGLAGIRIQTLHSLAKEILESAGRKIPGGAFLVELLIRRHGCEEPQLRKELDHLRDGMGVLVGTVVDFLEAGFEEVHLESLLEHLTELGAPSTQRVKAILRVACAVLRDMRKLGIGLNSTLLVLAREELESRAPGSLAGGPILIHGFADATGVGLDFMESLSRLGTCQLILDHPPWPGKWSQKDPGRLFTRRLLQRFSGKVPFGERPPGEFVPPELLLFKAPGAKAECRQVALLIQGLLQGGVRPEHIGVVARTLEPYMEAIRSQFLELGIPFSGLSAKGPQDPSYRSLVALEQLLLNKGRCKVELWLELLEAAPQRVSKHELLMACRCLGAARIEDVACLDLGRISERWPRGYPLPLSLGLGDEDEPGAPRRKIPLEELEALKNRASQLLDIVTSWMESQITFPEHIKSLEGLVCGCLGWSASGPWMSLLENVMEELRRDAPSGFPLTGQEFLLILGEGAKTVGCPRLGGKGGGVQVLEVMEARARTFEHLFLIGMNREIFPRPVKEDPLVPDSLRRTLLNLLPDLPLKEEGFEEERYLFAQLLSSSPRVTLSWQSTDEQGKTKGVSPLVERLKLEVGIEALYVGLPLWQECLVASSAPRLHSPKEHALKAALKGKRDLLVPLLALVLRECSPQALIWDPEEVAKARVQVLEEMDPDMSTPQGRARSALPGPYLGLAGSMRGSWDPRLSDLYVTTLESMAVCPWQSFLKKILRLEPPQDPLETLPELSRAQLGKLVHRVLESIVGGPGGRGTVRDLSKYIHKKPKLVSWPIGTEELERLSLGLAQELLQEEGISFDGLCSALAIRALPYLEVARETDWPGDDSSVPVLACEVQGRILLGEEQTRALCFRADRADLTPEGILLTDYKVGKSISEAAKEETRYKHLLKQVATGQRLQAAAYASLDLGGAKSTGRYLFLQPQLPETARVFLVNSKDEELLRKFRQVARLLMEAWDLGLFFPRLATPDGKKEPEQCKYCEVSLACVRGDSGARARLLRWAQVVRENPLPEKREALLLALWDLPAGGGAQSQQGELV